MRAHPFLVPLAVATTLMMEVVVHAQDWRTVDDFALAGGNAEARGVAVDAAGRIYAVGTANGQAIVRSSSDGGATWCTREDFVYPSETNNAAGTNNLFNAITINPQGDLYVGGASAAFVGGVNAGHWIVRRSRDQGVSWETVDDFRQPMNGPEPGTNGSVYSLSSDGQGRVYGAGLMLPTGPSYPRWWVRGSDTGGTNWDTKLVLFASYGGVSQMTWAGEDVYVTGSVSDSEVTTGLILRSSDYGASWSTNFESTNEVYLAITSDSAGNVYAAGKSQSSGEWLVRKAASGGTNWMILDQFSNSGYPRSITVDGTGNISVAGQPWLIRQYSAAAGQWSTTDDFSYSTNSYAVAMGTAFAPDGSAFVVGFGTSDSGQHRWLVRKQSASAPPPRLQIAVGGGSVTVSWPAAYTNSVLEWTDSPRVNQVWQKSAGTVCVMDGRVAVTFDLTLGARFFRLKSAAGQ